MSIKGFAAYENIAISIVNPRSVSKINLNVIVHIFDFEDFSVYYEKEGIYSLLHKSSVNIPTVTPDVTRHNAIYIFYFNGQVIKDRNGDADIIWGRIKDMVGVHQVMES